MKATFKEIVINSGSTTEKAKMAKTVPIRFVELQASQERVSVMPL